MNRNRNSLLIITIFVLFVVSIVLLIYYYPNKKNDVNVKSNDVNIKSFDNNLYEKNLTIQKIPEKIKKKILFNAKLMGIMSCEECDKTLKVYEFCYKGIKYFAIEGGYMAPVMKVSTNPMIFFETCNSKEDNEKLYRN